MKQQMVSNSKVVYCGQSAQKKGSGHRKYEPFYKDGEMIIKIYIETQSESQKHNKRQLTFTKTELW